jgi:ATP-dependent Clp protease ATP-binding subunit ClpB
MSEYLEQHSVAKLIGSPPGYVGYEEGGRLTEAVKRRPYSVLLFDEIEKAHPDVFNTLLQLLDDGRLTDGQGRTVNFTNTIILLTSNLKDMQQVKTFFRPEFINRLDDIIFYHSLNLDHTREIVKSTIVKFQNQLLQKSIHAEFTDEAIDELARQGYDEEYGARPLKRVFQKQIEDPIAMALIGDKVKPGGKIYVSHHKDFEFKYT